MRRIRGTLQKTLKTQERNNASQHSERISLIHLGVTAEQLSIWKFHSGHFPLAETYPHARVWQEKIKQVLVLSVCGTDTWTMPKNDQIQNTHWAREEVFVYVAPRKNTTLSAKRARKRAFICVACVHWMLHCLMLPQPWTPTSKYQGSMSLGVYSVSIPQHRVFSVPKRCTHPCSAYFFSRSFLCWVHRRIFRNFGKWETLKKSPNRSRYGPNVVNIVTNNDIWLNRSSRRWQKKIKRQMLVHFS